MTRPEPRRWTPALASLLLIAAALPAGAASIVLDVVDSSSAGFNDPAVASPVTGNPGTTVGQQRRYAFQAAADRWGQTLDSAVPIHVAASFDALDCTATSAALGGAGAYEVFYDFPGTPRAGTWYAKALADALAGSNLFPSDPDIVAVFTSALTGNPNCLGGISWWYGIGAPVPSGTLDFFTVVEHELAHGLGFATFVNKSTGEKLMGHDDIFMTFLEDHSRGQTWPSLTNGQRLASTTDTGDLHWVGPNVVAHSGVLSAGVHPSGHVLMYAPDPVEPGSSVSHWDTSLTPNELMEPFLNADAADLLTTSALEDEGWQGETAGTCVPDATTLCLQGNRFRVQVSWRTQVDTTGSGQVVPFGSDDSGLFYFFNPDNWEMLIKIIDGCTVNDHYWVFFAATTNVEFDVTVTDTQTGVIQPYVNALGHSADAVTDTAAFATCP
jgi:hypothetical protein